MDGLVSDYLRRTAPLPFVWGETDCVLWAASLWAEATGSDPAASLRGSYSTRREAAAIMARAGGLRALARSLMPAAPRLGIVGIARLGRHEIACIVAGGRAVMKRDRGIRMPADARLVEVW